MKNAFLFQTSPTLKTTPVLRYFLFFSFLFLGGQQNILHAQSRLSFQGILKKASGEAVSDGTYHLVFKLYTTETGVPEIWMEDQPAVDVVSGIYSVVLGNITPLNISFNQIYYLGVTAGSTEMTPRIQLTAAPYALALIGTTNQFPSSGLVKADSIKITGVTTATDGVIAGSGAPGNNGANKNGYAFSGDKDSGLFSTTANETSVYINNTEIVEVTPTVVSLKNDATLRLDTLGKISYNGLSDWRLVETDYFETDAEDWKIYSATGQPPIDAWKSTNGATPMVTTFNDDFAGKALVETEQGQTFKKKFTLPGSSSAGNYTYVKVKFRYFFLNSWDLGAEEVAYGAFSKTENCSSLSVGWFTQASYVSYGTNLGNNEFQFGPAANFVNGDQGNSTAQWSDQWKSGEMTGRYPSGGSNTDFWVIFGIGNNEGIGGESFGISMIEVWVK